MSAFFRKRIEATIEHMIGLLDQMDGDADFEPETVEEQNDREADPAERGISDKASLTLILAEASRRRRVFRH